MTNCLKKQLKWTPSKCARNIYKARKVLHSDSYRLLDNLVSPCTVFNMKFCSKMINEVFTGFRKLYWVCIT